MKENKINRLPDLPSKLLIVAMKDLEAVENNPSYRIDMTKWYAPSDYNYCSVCHAGAVMANTLNTFTSAHVDPEVFDRDTSLKLLSIDRIRVGDLDDFYDCWSTILSGGDLDKLKYLYGGTAIYDYRGNLTYDSSDFDEYLQGYDLYNLYDLDDLSNSKNPEYFQDYKNWIVSFIGILQAEGL